MVFGKFQSTLPLRGATEYPYTPPLNVPNFNPRSPYGERPPAVVQTVEEILNFNPRSPYGERLDTKGYSKINVQFQSTLPLRGATLSRPAG